MSQQDQLYLPNTRHSVLRKET